MNILIACDKFRGSLSANAANAAILRGLEASGLAYREAIARPVADGGEGTLDALMAGDMRAVSAPARGPFGDWRDVTFGFDEPRRFAVVDMASIAGHADAAIHGYDPDKASSIGVGDVIKSALDLGARTVVVALGGSITVDGGAGALFALGGRFHDAGGKDLGCPAGRGLGAIGSVDLSGLDARAADLTIIVAADVDNPLNGARGAAAVFGPQKGVAPENVPPFDEALASLDRAVAGALKRPSLGAAPFAGAAGGMLVGLSAIARTEPRDGFALVAEAHDLERLVAEVDLVVTGEGSLDSQSLSGKGPVAIARMAKAAGVPAIGFCGRLAVSPEELAAHGLIGLAISRGPQSLDEAIAGADGALTATATTAFDLVAAGRLLGANHGPKRVDP